MFRQQVDRAFKDIIRTVVAPDSARGWSGGLASGYGIRDTGYGGCGAVEGE